MKRKFLKIGAIIIAVGLVLGIVLSGVVAADEADQQSTLPFPPPNVLKGKVDSIAQDKTSFNIKIGDTAPITIKVDSNTKCFKIQVPQRVLNLEGLRERLQERLREGGWLSPFKDVERGLGQKNCEINWEEYQAEVGEEEIDEDSLTADVNGLQENCWVNANLLCRLGGEATFDDIAVGDIVIVRTMPNENLAKTVLIIKVEPSVINRVHGTIKTISSNSITIKKADGTEVVLSWDGNTRFILNGLIAVQAGQTATAIYNTETMKAKIVEVNPTPTTTTSASTTTLDVNI